MNTQDKPTEQLEAEEQREIQKQLDASVRLGQALQELRADKKFKLVFEEMFLKNGLNILWENTRHLTEEQLKGRGSDKNLEILELLKAQIKSRLDFQGFMDTVEADAINAVEEIRERNAESNEEEA